MACGGKSQTPIPGNNNVVPQRSVKFATPKEVVPSEELFAEIMRLKLRTKDGVTRDEMETLNLTAGGNGTYGDTAKQSPRFRLKKESEKDRRTSKSGRIYGINDIDTKLRYSHLVKENDEYVNLRDVVLHHTPGFCGGDFSESSSLSSEGYEALQEERFGRILHLLHSIKLAEPDSPVEGRKRGKAIAERPRRRGVEARKLELEIQRPTCKPKEAVICINSTTGEERKKIIGEHDQADDVSESWTKSRNSRLDESEREDAIREIDNRSYNEVERPPTRMESPRLNYSKSSMHLDIPQATGRPRSAPSSRPLKSALKNKRKHRVKSATSAAALSQFLPRQSFFNSHDVALKAAGYDLSKFVKKTRPAVRFNENVKIENIPNDIDAYQSSDEEKDGGDCTHTDQVTEPKQPEQKSAGHLSFRMIATCHILAQRSHKKKASVPDDSLKVDRKLLVEYLTRVKERPREFAALLKASRDKSAKDNEFNRLVKLASVSRLTQQPTVSRKDTPIMKAVKGLVTRDFDPSHIRRNLGYNRRLRRRSSLMSVSSIASSVAESLNEVCKDIPPDASVLERSKLKVEKWLHTVTTSQLEKAKDAAMQELGEVNHSRKWWELNRECRYLRQPGTHLDPEPDFEDIVY